jgi:hypothetical protein
MAIGVGVSFFGFSLGIPFDFMTTMQMVHLTPVLRIFIPTSLTRMFQHFSTYNFMPITQTNWRLNRTVDDYWSINHIATTYNFHKMGFTTNAFLINSTPVLFVITIVSFLHPILTLSRIAFPNINYLNNFDKKWKDNFLLFVIFLGFNIICFNAMMNYQFFNVMTDNEWANSLVAMFFLCGVAVFFIFIVMSHILYWYELRMRRKEGKNVDLTEEELKTANFRE